LSHYVLVDDEINYSLLKGNKKGHNVDSTNYHLSAFFCVIIKPYIVATLRCSVNFSYVEAS